MTNIDKSIYALNVDTCLVLSESEQSKILTEPSELHVAILFPW